MPRAPKAEKPAEPKEKKPRKPRQPSALDVHGNMPDDTQTMLLFEKLGKDQATAAEGLRRGQARYLVDMYYDSQRQRVRADAQVREAEKSGEPNLLVSWFADTFRYTEKSLNKGLGRFARQFTVGQWLQSIHGIGPVISAGLLCYFDIRIANHASRFHSYAGLDPTKTWEKGQKRPWNAALKTLCVFKAGECFVKTQNSDKSFYGPIFREERDRLERANEAGEFKEAAAHQLAIKKYGAETDARAAYEQGKLPPAHLHARARRKVVKLFISHLHYVMFDDFHGKPPELPWIFEKSPDKYDHKHFIAPPGWANHKFTGKPIADLYIGTQEPVRKVLGVDPEDFDE